MRITAVEPNLAKLASDYALGLVDDITTGGGGDGDSNDEEGGSDDGEDDDGDGGDGEAKVLEGSARKN